MSTSRNRSRAVAVGAALLLPTTLLLTAQTASAAPSMVKINGTMPRWLARTAGARTASVGAKSSQQLSVRVYLAPKGGQQALVDKVAALSDPASVDYGQYLSTAQYAAAYEPTAASAASVQRYLRSAGLKVTSTEAHRRYVTASGTVKQLDKAFHVSLRSMSHDGQKVTAPTTAASLPASVASAVLTVSGLDTTTAKMTHSVTPKATTPPEAFQNARPCSLTYGQIAAKYQGDYKTPLPKFNGATLPYAPCGYTGPYLREAYTPGTTLSGKGVTVAITDAYRWQLIASDANRYATEHGDGAYVKGQLTENLPKTYTNQADCDPSGWSGEETLDVEAVHAMAPDAKIRYYASSSCLDGDFLDTLARVVDENVAKVVSNSWSDVEQNETADAIVAYEQVFLQGAAQGISFLFSSGDSGDELARTALKQVDYPASDPYATAVGGTSTGIDASGKKIFDTGWGTVKYNLSADGKSWTSVGFTSGAGGGYSALFNRPTYQNGVVPASAPAGRAVPDIAMDADPNTGMLVGQTQTFPDSVHYGEYRIGGTSLASPLLAGMTALSIQQNGGRGFGALNPKLYSVKGIADDVVNQPTRVGVVRADYTDPTRSSSKVIYSVRTFGHDSSLAVTKGWDPVTGIGVPNAKYLKLTTPASAALATATR